MASSPLVLPLLPLRNTLLFPHVTLPIDLGRASSIEAVRSASRKPFGDPAHNLLVIAPQRDALTERPHFHEMHPFGVVGRLVQVVHGIPGRMTVMIRGLYRVRINALEAIGSSDVVRVEAIEEELSDSTMALALSGAIVELLAKHEELSPVVADDSDKRSSELQTLKSEANPAAIADITASFINLDHKDSLQLLEEKNVNQRLKFLLENISQRIQFLQVKRDIDSTVRAHLSRHEHEAVLRHKLRAIKTELGEAENDKNGLQGLAARLEKLPLPEAVRKVTTREFNRLRRMDASSGEATICRTYLECICDLPWPDPENKVDRSFSIKDARALLEREHHGQTRVKKRVIEYLSTLQLAPDHRGPILCLTGPPGVGKTSIARSIADALSRPFIRISLGGVKDASEIRGHRRTYVGAQPGRLIQAMRNAGTAEPVILLDEIDKLAQSGSEAAPTSALLEALDREQNDAFEDHYLSFPYDLSKVLFICTANEYSAIPSVLADRLERINLSGYTRDEKKLIAEKYLLPRELKENGLTNLKVKFQGEALNKLANEYTRESGVRNLQRKLASVLRDLAMRITEGKKVPEEISCEDLSEILGPPRYQDVLANREPKVGVATGLGWTSVGGKLLFVEATSVKGKGRLRLTGSLGDVMKESGQTALSFVRSRAKELRLSSDFFVDRDIHLHLPAGGVPKDGPSAGITLATAIISLLTEQPVRHDFAMTGEVTLRGHVLPVGGIREKVLAAHRAGIKDIILPARNRKDEPEIPESTREGLRLHYVNDIDEVLDLALEQSTGPQ